MKRLSSVVLGILVILLVVMPFSTMLLQLVRFYFEQHGTPLSPSLVRVTVGWKEILLGFGLALFCIRWVIERKFPFVLTKLDTFLLTFIAFAVFWGSQHTSLKSVVFGFRYDLSPFLYYALARSVNVSRVQLMKYMRILCYCAIPVFLFGIAQTLFLPDDLLTHIGYSWAMNPTGNPLPPVHLIGTTVRAMSTFAGPNSLAMYAVLILFISWFIIPRKQQFVRYGLIIISLATLVATFSRGHLVSLVAASTMVLFYSFFSKRGRFLVNNPLRTSRLLTLGTYFVLAMSLVVIMLYGTARGSNDSAALNVILHNESTIVHHDVRVQAWASIKQHPFGTGLGTSGLATTNSGGAVFNPESWYIQITQELGWVGLLGGLAVLAAVFGVLGALLYDLPDKEDHDLALFFTASFIAIAVSANFLPSWFEVGSIAWWILFGMFLSDYLRSLPRSTIVLTSHKKA